MLHFRMHAGHADGSEGVGSQRLTLKGGTPCPTCQGDDAIASLPLARRARLFLAYVSGKDSLITQKMDAVVLPAFGLGLPGSDGRFVACQIGPHVKDYLLAALRTFAPATFVVRLSDLEQVAATQDLRDAAIVDYGEKTDRRVEPHRLVSRWPNKILILRIRYTSTGKALYSVVSLQTKLSSEKKQQTVTLLGIPDDVFDGIPEKVGTYHAAATTPSRAAPRSEDREETPVVSSPPVPRRSALTIPSSIMNRYRGVSPATQRVREDIMLSADTDEPVLIRGEHGTGRKVVARLIHDHGHRCADPFQGFDCNSTIPQLFYAELFGAAGREGLFQLTSGGTLVIAETHFLPLPVQREVLRVVKRPSGRAGVRIIATTSADLDALMRSGKFLRELMDVLKPNTIRTPSLREHPEDVPVLAEFYWEQLTLGRRRPLPFEVLQALKAHPWPGNVDDLKEVLKILYARHNDVTLRDLREAIGDYIVRHGYRSHTLAASPSKLSTTDAQLAHLTKTAEVLREYWVAVRDVRYGVPLETEILRTVITVTKTVLHELDKLCAKPFMFSKPIYQATLRLKGKLMWFDSVLRTTPDEAHAAWKRDVAEEYERTESAFFDERDRLMNGR